MVGQFQHPCLSVTVSLILALMGRADSPTRTTPGSEQPGDSLPQGAIARLGTLRFRHADPVTAMVFTPHSKSLFSASGGEGSRDNTIRLWALPDGREIKRYVGHSSGIFCLALSPDGRRLASAGNGGGFAIWDGG